MVHVPRFLRIGLSLLFAAGLFAWLITQPLSRESAQSGKTLSLHVPAFVKQAHAAPELDIAAKLDDEAGISAYFKSPDAISLSQVRGVFRTIELETADYIIGSVPISGYNISYDAHVYVNKNGWVLAYYLASDPAGKIFDSASYSGTTITTTKLRNVIAAIASAVGAPFSGVTHYDFRYPNATNMMLVAGYAPAYLSPASFQINLPDSYGYFHRSWFSGGCVDTIRLDGVNLGGGNYGAVPASQLQPSTFHTMTVSSGCSGGSGGGYAAKGGLLLIYRVL